MVQRDLGNSSVLVNNVTRSKSWICFGATLNLIADLRFFRKSKFKVWWQMHVRPNGDFNYQGLFSSCNQHQDLSSPRGWEVLSSPSPTNIHIALCGRWGRGQEEWIVSINFLNVGCLFSLLYLQDPQDEEKLNLTLFGSTNGFKHTLTLLQPLILCSCHHYVLVLSLNSLIFYSAHKCMQEYFL